MIGRCSVCGEELALVDGVCQVCSEKDQEIDRLKNRIRAIENELDDIQKEVVEARKIVKAAEGMAEVLARHLNVPVSQVWWLD